MEKKQQRSREGPYDDDDKDLNEATIDQSDKRDQGVVRDERGQLQPKDRRRAQKTARDADVPADQPPVRDRDRA